ncbi:EpsG family protein [Proteus terrae]|uniref:EpsG family protein n=1 Tax=Proteus terrae TaxID=1574161 RepID=UPI003A8CF7B3
MIKFNTYNILNILSFFINPVLSLLFSIILLINKKKVSIILLSLSISLILVYQPLMYDTSSNFYLYYYQKGDSLYNLIAQFLHNLYGLDYYHIIFFYTFIIIYTWFKPILFHINRSSNNKIYFLIILLSIASLSYRNIMDLNRTMLSISISFYYIFYINYKHKDNLLNFILFSIISLLIHPVSIIIYIFLLLSKKIKSINMYILYILFCFFIGLFFSSVIKNISSVTSSYDNYIFNTISYYLNSEKWGEINYTFNFLLRKIIELTICLLTIYISFKEKKKNNNQNNFLYNLIILISGICLLFMDFKTFFERIFLILNLFYISLYFYKKSLNITDIILSILIIIYFFSINFIVYGKVFNTEYNEIIPNNESRFSIQIKPFYYPTIYLLNIDNGYSDEYISTHSTWGNNNQ